MFKHVDATLARRSSVCTNVVVLKAANGKIVFLADRQDDILTQIGDRLCYFYIAGINKVSTDAQGLWWDGKEYGNYATRTYTNV